MAFTDAFTQAGVTVDLATHVPTGGTAWTRTGAADSIVVNEGANTARASGGSTAIYVCDDQGSANHYTQARLKILNASGFGNAFLASRLVDSNNFVGWRLSGAGGSGSRLVKCVSGTVTDLVTHQGTDESIYKVECDGTNVKLYEDGVQQGSTQTVSDHQTETSQGLVNRNENKTVDWLDDFEAGALGGGATEYTITGDVTGTLSPAGGFQFNQNKSLAGDSGIAIVPAASVLLKNQNPTIGGDSSITVVPTASALVFNQNAAIVGDSGFALTPIAAGLGYNQNHVMAGSTAISLTPAASLQYNAQHAIVGDSTISYAIAATMVYTSASTNAITGDVTLSLAPAAAFAFNQNPAISGDSAIAIVVASSMANSQGAAIVGDVSVALSPEAGLAYNIHAEIGGAASISVESAAAMAYHASQSYLLNGSLTLSVTPAAVMSFTLSGDLELGEVFTVPREIREFTVPAESRIFTVH